MQCRALELEQWQTAWTLIREGASPLKTCYSGAAETTALHKAIELGSVDITSAILKQIAAGVHSVENLQTVCASMTPLLL